MSVDNLNADLLKELLLRVKKLETGAPVGRTSVSEGALRILSPEGLIVEGSARVAGTLSVTGTETVTGTLRVTGTLDADGTIDLSGPVTITGDTTMTGDMTVNGGGKITVSGSVPMTLGITSNGRPGVQFSGGRMSSDGSRIAMESGGSAVGAAPGFASLSNGSTAIIAMPDGPYLYNLPTTTNAPNIYVNPSTGKLYRSTAGGIEA